MGFDFYNVLAVIINHCTRTEFEHIKQQRISAPKVGTLTEFQEYLQSLLVRGGAVLKKTKLRPFYFTLLAIHYSLVTQALNNTPCKKQMRRRMSVTL